MKEGSFVQKIGKFGDYVFKLYVKALVEKMKCRTHTIGKNRACGFMSKAREQG